MNSLSSETSPYLLQHKDNPVNWYAWGPEAFKAAKDTDKPILLSSGYAACHWCHVMAHECFENHAIATYMNEHFINIKLDREERPDVDRLYMASLHAMGEQGGWPLNMFLTPELKPFWGGTYFPPEPRYGRPSFLQVLHAITRLWDIDREKAITAGDSITDHFRDQLSTPTQPQTLPTPAHLQQLALTMTNACDMVNGGLKGAPKFPQAPVFQFLWQQNLASSQGNMEEAVVTTLTNISNGGIYDHLGGGIARYATDARWLIPHFEKMLYDNAQFVSLASRVCLNHPNALLKEKVQETISFMLRDMRNAEGLFTSSYDADAEGEEGKYYIWSVDEIAQILPPEEAKLFQETYDVTPAGNFEGKSILNRLNSPKRLDEATEQNLRQARDLLLGARQRRVPPLHDDKILADWNGLAITAMAEAAYVFKRQDWLDNAKQSLDANLSLFWKDGRLWHSHRQGQTKHRATAHDYAHLIEAAITIASLDTDSARLQTALELSDSFESQHWDQPAHGFLLTAKDTNDLPANSLSVIDDVTPSPNAMMVKNYLNLHYLTGQTRYMERAHEILSHHINTALANPFAAPAMLAAAQMLNAPIQITIYGEKPMESELLRSALRRTGMNSIIICKPRGDGPASLTLCKGTHCSLPAINEKGVQDALSFIGM